MNIVIPMAGKSERYRAAGFDQPKFLLPVGEKTMIEKVVGLFDTKNDNYFFIVNADDENRFEVSKFLSSLPIRQKTRVISSHNFGPSYSLLQAGNDISPKEEVIVNYCDFLMDWDYPAFLSAVRNGNYDGGLASFRGFHPASLGETYYAYLRVSDRNEVLELREKQPFTANRIDEHASTGTYYFRQWSQCVAFLKKQIGQGVAADNNEYYPSMIFNLMKQDGLRSLAVEAKKFICLGTPRDYHEYRYWQEYFS